ncbi:hypothetical protein pdam_00025113, partial [Pocillopora damicornis]
MNLIPEQMVVMNAIRTGKSVFFTGSARTGKSYLLKRLITMLPPQSTLVTASTGAAACHIGGTTLHVCSDALVSKLTATKNQLIEQGGILATKLCTHKENVNQINDIHLTRLPGEKKVFEATDSDSGMSAMLDSHVPVSYVLELKVGAQLPPATKQQGPPKFCFQ